MKKILVINPNRNVAVTEEIKLALSDLGQDAVNIDCITLHDGPPGVETQKDVECAAALVIERVAADSADAYVVACFSDPGVLASRSQVEGPVLGIGEAGALTAMTLGEKFGVIAILDASVQRQQRQMRTLGIDSRYAGSKAVGLTVKELSDERRTLERMLVAGAWLRDERQADVLVLGCAGMARHQATLERELKLPVVEPSRAATAMAIGLVDRRSNIRSSK
ncbi:MAG TPA: aspartate/glutamate racemase family protein [Lacipirellulaceae bacterium]|nr:aspartate/glutamate racemase family protein [Lacipirellulaceae bacterium]